MEITFRHISQRILSELSTVITYSGFSEFFRLSLLVKLKVQKCNPTDH